MSKAAEYRALEKQIAEQLQALEALKGSADLQKELEFEDKLRKLMDKYGMSLRSIIDMLDPQAGRGRTQAQTQSQGQRRERAVKRYVNPHTQEVVETKGGNQKTLKAWKAEHGPQEVESWLQ
ncbi:histone-like nucleoid-structuring protein, MvaT/MvaU family [Stutzerimonas nitrititolerans]|uniref:histone-like nucleoid-structuring protein, MvaT/MvaU family n=1 Tax=Stutzerimonas nitrititolerans TaxID=2482751 RepID=UPI00289D85DE|nr:histone-like nucleoid-structuring protein, MvaT/MvaU family [Stutzerimonas nitrititolerans]